MPIPQQQSLGLPEAANDAVYGITIREREPYDPLKDKSTREQLREAQGGKCAMCGHPPPYRERLQLDHRQALCNGGSNAYANLWLICRRCHEWKTSNDIVIWHDRMAREARAVKRAA
jgi:5-methylcytosine-specific restriction endonuclease McrA